MSRKAMRSQRGGTIDYPAARRVPDDAAERVVEHSTDTHDILDG